MKMIDIAKIKNARPKADGSTIGQCPACAEVGGDSKGEHLIVNPDDSFGCVVHQKYKRHNADILRHIGLEDSPPYERPRIPVRRFVVPDKKLLGRYQRLGGTLAA